MPLTALAFKAGLPVVELVAIAPSLLTEWSRTARSTGGRAGHRAALLRQVVAHGSQAAVTLSL